MSPKFLVDENVRHELFVFLKNEGFDTKITEKGASDAKLTGISLKEKRILVTNDNDFEICSKSEIFSVILLKIPQSDRGGLIKAFRRLIKKNVKLGGKIVVLSPNDENIFNLAEEFPFNFESSRA